MKTKQLIVILFAILVGISVSVVISMKSHPIILSRIKSTELYINLKSWEEKQIKNVVSTGRKLIKSIQKESNTGGDIEKIENKIIGKHMCSLRGFLGIISVL